MTSEDPQYRPKGKSLRPLLALLPFIAPYRGMLGLALGMLVAASGTQLALPLLLRRVIDLGISTGNGSSTNLYFAELGVTLVVFCALAAGRAYCLGWLGERVVADLRNAVYRRIICMDPSFFEVTQTGEVLSRLTADTTLVQSISGIGLSLVLRSLLQLPGALLMLAITNLRLMGYIVVLIPLVLVPIVLIGRPLRRLSRASQDRIADSSALAGESLNAVQIVQAFTAEGLLAQRFQEAVEISFRTAIKRTLARTFMIFTAFLCVFGGMAFVFWVGAEAVLAGRMSYGQLGQFGVYAVFAALSAGSLTEMWGEIQRASGAMERLAELLRARSAIQAPANPRSLKEPGEGRIRFEIVSFSYPSRPDTRALDGFNLEIKPGEVVAFVGPSGAGKSTTFQLLLRFYDPSAGRILLDGVDIAHASPQDVRKRIAIVPQDTVIFGATARENIRFGQPQASDAAIEAAARVAEADEFIRELPQGYDTFLGERGTRLSGGQRQRIAIARAILKDPPILLLDEATSSLDAENERLVQEALDHLVRDRTTIIIAHRLATVLKADRIVVMDRGRSIDVGSHAELVRRNPLYARLAELQFVESRDLESPLAPVPAAVAGLP